MEDWIRRFDGDDLTHYDSVTIHGPSALSFRTGLSARRIWGIRNLDVPNTSFDIVDALLVGTEQCELWFLPPEQGGLADYYYPDNPPAPVAPNETQKLRQAKNRTRRYVREGKITSKEADARIAKLNKDLAEAKALVADSVDAPAGGV